MTDPTQPGPVERPSIGQAIAELVQMFVDYVRQETGDIVREKIVLPTQTVGQVVAFALAAAGIMMLGVAFLAVAAMMLLAQFVTWPGALGIIGGLLLFGAGILTYLKMRKVQR